MGVRVRVRVTTSQLSAVWIPPKQRTMATVWRVRVRIIRVKVRVRVGGEG